MTGTITKVNLQKVRSRGLGNLIINPKLGIAYQEDRTEPIEYDKKYLDKIKSKTKKEVINTLRKNLVVRFCPKPMVLDIGCGDGSFLKTMGRGYGFDIIPEVVKSLGKHYINPTDTIPDNVNAITMWDSLEHMAEPAEFLKLIHKQTLFVSIPIIENILNVKQWKHYRPGEHLFYFTNNGFIEWMYNHGFGCVAFDDYETKAGREDVMSYVFKRA